MGQVKKLFQDAIERGYAYSTEPQQHADLLRRERNAAWHEDMPDLSGQALADMEAEFMSERSEDIEQRDEADNLPLWIQLELDLWENKQGYGGECAL